MKRAGGGRGDPEASLEHADICQAIEKRLFLGKLPASTSEEELCSVFEQYGSLSECRVVAGRGPTSNSVGFVGFSSWAAAHRALLECDGKQQMAGHSGDQTIVVSFAERKSTVGRGGGAAYSKGLDVSRVFVGRLPEDATDTEISACFSSCGIVEHVNLLAPKGRNRCAYVTFKCWGEAMDAVELNAGHPLRAGDQTMTVVLAQPKDGARCAPAGLGAGAAQRGGADDVAPWSKEPAAKRRRDDRGGHGAAGLDELLDRYAAVALSGAPGWQLDELHEQVVRARGQAAPVSGGGGGGRSAAAPPVGSGGGGGGRRPQDVLWGTAASAAPAAPALDEPDAARLFIGGLPSYLEDSQLQELAEQISFPGLPRSATTLLECRTLPGKGCGYLRYSSWEAAEQAFQNLNDRAVEGWEKALRVKWSTPKGGGGGGPVGGAEGRDDGYRDRGGPRGDRDGGRRGDRDGDSRRGGGGGDGRGRSHGDGRQDRRSGRGEAPIAEPEVGEIQGSVDPNCFASEAELAARGLDPTRLFIGQLNRRDSDLPAKVKPMLDRFGNVLEFRWIQEKGVMYARYKTTQEAQAAIEALGNRSVSGISKCLNVQFSQQKRS